MDGGITFEATRFRQFLRGAAVESAEQQLDAELRGNSV
jgi:hypothetical protein